jgi:hypothetical protein
MPMTRGTIMDLGIQEHQVAMEAIATLVNVKRVMCDLILKPAGVPREVYFPLLNQRDDTGRPLTKRELAPLILDAIKDRSDYPNIVRAIVEIAAHWSQFYLAPDEFIARGVVQKAREVLHIIETNEAEEARQQEQRQREEKAQAEQRQAEQFRKEVILLLMFFDDLMISNNVQQRGYQLQELLNRVFILHEIPVYKSFTRNEGGEQIDGAFSLGDWYYLVECRWRERLADIRQLDGLKGQVDRSGRQTMGLFLSINGWSDNVGPLLKQNPSKSIILMDGYDLRGVLSGQADLRDFLRKKIAKLNLESEPFLGLTQYLKVKNE